MLPDPVETNETSDSPVTVENTEGEQNSTDLESRFGLFGKKRFGNSNRQYGPPIFGRPPPPPFGRPPPPPFGRPPPPFGGNPYESGHSGHYQPRPDYPTHHHHEPSHHHHEPSHHHHNEGPHYSNHNQPPAYPLQVQYYLNIFKFYAIKFIQILFF